MEQEPQNFLVIGTGAREHALVWKLRQSRSAREIFVAPGNGGTGEAAVNVDIDPSDIDGLLRFASDNAVDVTVVGPEASLAAGVVDAFEEDGLSIFGPSKDAARLETDKAWAVGFMERHDIPHPFSISFRQVDEATAYVERTGPRNVVIKASGLAGGKGVVLPETLAEARDALGAMMTEKRFGQAGEEVVIQERLVGREVSLLSVTDGVTVVPLLPVQDHKRLLDNDEGPNTGGMGAYAPIPWLRPEIIEEIHDTVLKPTVDGMKEEGVPYKGVLYAGLMMTSDGPKVLEYNVRFGDPETQPLMQLLASDLSSLLVSSISGTLRRESVRFRDGYSVCVVLALQGYPTHPSASVEVIEIPKLANNTDVHMFHAGTLIDHGKLVTNGGRVFGVTAFGADLDTAIKRAYHAARAVHFEGMQFRGDIGFGGLASYD